MNQVDFGNDERSCRTLFSALEGEVFEGTGKAAFLQVGKTETLMCNILKFVELTSLQ